MTGHAALGRRMKEARIAREISKAELARTLSVTTRTVSDWESGASRPRPNRIPILCGVLGVPLIWLMDGDPRLDPFVAAADPLDSLNAKVERLETLQRQVADLSADIASDVADIREDDSNLAA